VIIQHDDRYALAGRPLVYRGRALNRRWLHTTRPATCLHIAGLACGGW
jgi:hypothetical protein